MHNDDSILKAINNLNDGCNCAQAVLGQYCESFGLDIRTAMKLASGFGGGMRMGKTCGAITGGIMVLGLKYGFDQPGDSIAKETIEGIISEYITNVRKSLGTCDCNELLGIDVTVPEVRKLAKEEGIFKEKCPVFIRMVMEELNKRLVLTS